MAPTVDKVLAAVSGAGLDPEQRDDLAVAVAEALSNAAVHGNALDESRTVRVIVRVVPQECAIVEVHDSGPGFDASTLSDPTDPARVLMPGGRGVFLMRRLVDTLEYNPAGNVVRLTMRRGTSHRRGSEPE